MRPSIHVVVLGAVTLAACVAACAQTSQQPASVTAPTASASAETPVAASSPSPAPTASSSPAPSATSAPTAALPPESATPAPGPVGGEGAAAPQFRACHADADCVAVPRVACCPHGWLEAVNVSQKDAYAKANACTRARTICPMFMVRDSRVARCNMAAHLCEMVKP